MVVSTLRGTLAGPVPVAQAKVRVRTAADLWRKIRKLNDSDAARMKISAAYLELEDVLELVPQRYRIVLGGSIKA